MNIFRVFAISLPQLLILLDIGAGLDLLGGLNRTDAGFGILLILFVSAPVVTMLWFIFESIRSHRLAKHQNRSMSLLMPGLALFVFFESLAIDISLLSQARM